MFDMKVCLCALCLAIVTTSVVAAQDITTTRKPLVFADREKSEVYKACDLAIRLNLNGPATTGDVDRACRCVDNAFMLAEIPEKYSDNFIWVRPEGKVINTAAIHIVSHGDLIPGPIKIRANRLGWEVRTCWGVLPTRSQMDGDFARNWKSVPDKRVDYPGTIVEPTDGPPAPVDGTLGGLILVKLERFSQVIWEYTMSRSDLSGEQQLKARSNAYKFMQTVASNGDDFSVLKCAYRTQAKNNYNRWMTTRPYYYWYKPDFTAAVQNLAETAPADHPARRVGPARSTCPLREPQ